MKKKKLKQFMDIAETYQDSRIEAPCPHFGECGGCLFQDFPYDIQLRIKKDYLNKKTGDLWDFQDVEGSDPFGYRNRMDFVTAFGKMGLRQRGNYRKVVDLSSCLLVQERTRKAFELLRPLALENEGYDYLQHRGYLRYLVFRQGFFTNELMINPVVASEENKIATLVDTIGLQADSVSILLSDGLADLSFGPVTEEVKRGYIYETLEDIRFRIGPNSFFQSNSPVALRMYRSIREKVKGKTLDLYSGVGSISLFVASSVENVTGIEVIKDAVEDAKINMKENGIENVHFVCADVADYLAEHGEEFDTLVMDPPRAGLHPRVVKYIMRAAPERIVYMSCNPLTFAEDARHFTEKYTLDHAEAYDMFPQTPHVELIGLFNRK
jgi:tRNA (uracil-5-)-methyltransferase